MVAFFILKTSLVGRMAQANNLAEVHTVQCLLM